MIENENDGVPEEADKSGEWWEKLYQPHFCLDDWDEVKPKESLKDEDNVYFRVWKRMEEKKEKIMTGEISFESKLKNEFTQTDECIWNSRELEIIKGVTKTLKTENHRLKAILREKIERIELLERKCKSQGQSLSKKSDKLSEALKANERFAILVSSLHDQTLKSRGLSEHLEKSLTAAKDDIKQKQKELAEKTEYAMKLESGTRKLKSKLDELLADQERTIKRVREEEKARYIEETSALCEKISRLESALQREQICHAATRRGLDRLITHYSKDKQEADIDEEIMLAKMQIL